jgi:hypothetical protein
MFGRWQGITYYRSNIMARIFKHQMQDAVMICTTSNFTLLIKLFVTCLLKLGA